jgi:hypothetical protein
VNGLERRLLEAASQYPFPPTPDLREEVLRRLPRRRPIGWRKPAVAVPIVVAAIGAVVALSPSARSAFLDWFDAIPGVRIARVEKLPRSELLPALDFGRRVPLERARNAVGFELRLPSGVGRPTAAYLDRDPTGESVATVAYDSRLVVTEWRSRELLFYKLVGRGTRVEPVEVGRTSGVWITGGDHAVFYLGGNGAEYSRDGRLAGNVLLWQEHGVGYRLEGRFSRERALELARTLAR